MNQTINQRMKQQMNHKITWLYVKAGSAVRERTHDEDGIISTEAAVVGAVVIAAAVAIAAKFTSLFDSAIKKIPDSL